MKCWGPSDPNESTLVKHWAIKSDWGEDDVGEDDVRTQTRADQSLISDQVLMWISCRPSAFTSVKLMYDASSLAS